MTKLRQQMDDDMLARGRADRTRESYWRAVTGLARFYRRSPDQITDAEIQAYMVHLLRDRHLAWSTCNIVVCGLRFFYHITLKRDRTTFSIPSPRQSGKAPFVLSREEVQRLLTHAANQTYRTMLMTASASGLRLPLRRPHEVRDVAQSRAGPRAGILTRESPDLDTSVAHARSASATGQPSVSAGRIVGAMPPATNTPPVARVSSARLPASALPVS